jgi:hypothetical protein
MAAAREFLRLAESGRVTPSEVREAQRVISTTPELKDAFGSAAKELGALLGGQGVFRDVGRLTPDTERLTDARTMPERFLADLKLIEQQLLNHPGMTRTEKAERLFQFFEAYAARFQDLAHGAAQDRQAATAQPPQGGALHTTETGLQLANPLNDAELTKALAQFDKALDRAGFPQLTAGDGRTGMEAAREMLEARTPEQLAQARPAKPDAPGWKDNPELSMGIDKARRGVELNGPNPLIQPKLTPQQQVDEEKKKKDGERKRERGTDGVLGGRMVWNVLHLLRGDDLTDVERRDAMNQLVVAGVLVLILTGILVGVLVWM